MSELGYITVVDRQGQGVAYECIEGLISLLFEREDHRRLFVEIDDDNLASIALIERLGFKREGCLREYETTHRGSATSLSTVCSALSGEHRRDRDCAEGQANVRNGLKAAAKRMVRLRPEAAIPADAANVPFSPKADNRLQPTPCLAADLRLTPKHCVFG